LQPKSVIEWFAKAREIHFNLLHFFCLLLFAIFFTFSIVVFAVLHFIYNLINTLILFPDGFLQMTLYINHCMGCLKLIVMCKTKQIMIDSPGLATGSSLAQNILIDPTPISYIPGVVPEMVLVGRCVIFSFKS